MTGGGEMTQDSKRYLAICGGVGGAKLALLVAEEVVTETRRGRFHGATRWHLETPLRAPWR